MATVGDIRTPAQQFKDACKVLANVGSELIMENEAYASGFMRGRALVDQLTDMLDGMAGSSTFAGPANLIKEAREWLRDTKAYFDE